MRFEKWQALGNDYLIVERAELPFELTPGARPPAVRRRTSASAPTASCCSRARRARRTWPTCGSSTPTARRPSCRATARARRSCTCAAAAGPTATSFSIGTAAGRIRPTITGPDTCTRRHGHARASARADFPAGPPDGRGRAQRRRARVALSARLDRQPAVRDPRRLAQELAALDLGRDRAARSKPTPSFPNRTNVSWYASSLDAGPPARIRARIFERGVGETLSSGTGASGAAVAYACRTGGRGGGTAMVVVLDGGELEVEVGEDLQRRPDRLGAARVRGPPQRRTSKRSCMRPSKRLERIPPYAFAQLERKIAEKRAAGVDVISLGIGDPDRPTPPLIVEAMQEAVSRAGDPPLPHQPRPRRTSARRSATSTSGASTWRSTPSARSSRRSAPRRRSSTSTSPSWTPATTRSRPTPATPSTPAARGSPAPSRC